MQSRRVQSFTRKLPSVLLLLPRVDFCTAPLPEPLQHCKTRHERGCFSHTAAAEYNANEPAGPAVFRQNGVEFFLLSEELVRPGPKRIELAHYTDTGKFKLRQSEWVLCDCDHGSPCYSQGRCDAADKYHRLPYVPARLVFPDVQGSRKMVRFLGTNEPFMVEAITTILRGSCSSKGARFVDSGMNEGMWTLLAAAFGCHAIGIEPQPQCIMSASTALQANNLSATIINKLLAPDPLSVEVNVKKPCNGAWKGNPSSSQSKLHAATIPIQSTRLDDLQQLKGAKKVVELWHVDVEGAELQVLRSASKLFMRNQIKRVIFEVSHGSWKDYGTSSIKEGYRELRTIFTGWHCTWACNGDPFPFKVVPFGAVHCGPRWGGKLRDLGWGLYDVFCVAPDTKALWSAS